MPNLNIDISFNTDTLPLIDKREDTPKTLSLSELVDFIMGKYGDIYLNILVPHDGVSMELHAKKADMKKKNSSFDIMPLPDGTLKVAVKGTFKVSAYSHVAERITTLNPPIYVTGIYAGDYPPVGADFKSFNKETQVSEYTGQLAK
jgi:hypothetical protein